jgi:hypothetical protein
MLGKLLDLFSFDKRIIPENLDENKKIVPRKCSTPQNESIRYQMSNSYLILSISSKIKSGSGFSGFESIRYQMSNSYLILDHSPFGGMVWDFGKKFLLFHEIVSMVVAYEKPIPQNPR